MESVRANFLEKVAEIDEYINFLKEIEQQSANGPPKLEGSSHVISVTQRKILYSSVYLQLYNLVESTVNLLLEKVGQCATNGGNWSPADLSEQLLKEWVRSKAKTHADLNYDNRLANALELCQHLVQLMPVLEFSIEKGGGGNWDDNAIEKVSNRIGCSLAIPAEILAKVKQHVKDEMGPMVLVKSYRNRLAHGKLTFSECSENVTVSELFELKETTTKYLTEVIDSYRNFMAAFKFLKPEKRPV